MKNKGFTLIELAIVLCIGGLIMAAAFEGLSLYLKSRKIQITNEKLEMIDEQIQLFLEENGRLPCPAERYNPPDSMHPTSNAIFGVSIGTPNGCPETVIAPPGFVLGGGSVYLGVVPVRTLNLPDNFMLDGWGNRIRYAVSVDQAQDLTLPGGGFRIGGGRISVVDGVNNSIVTPPATADYVLFSTGENMIGAIDSMGNLVGPLCGVHTGTAPNGDLGNCDGEITFRSTLAVREGTGPVFDDIVKFRRITGYNRVLDPNSILPFNVGGGNCPPGWERPVPAIPDTGSLVYCRKE